jgi:hypothetical protein
MLHPKIWVSCRHELIKQDLSQQYDSVFIRQIHFTGGCGEKKHDEQCRVKEKLIVKFVVCPTPIELNTSNFGVKESHNMFLKLEKNALSLSSIDPKINPCEFEKLSGQFLGLIVMSHWLADDWIRIQNISVLLPLSLFRVENHVCLSLGVQVTSATWRGVMRIVVEVGDLVQRTGDSQAQVGYSATGQSGGRVTLCAVCTINKESRSAGFLVEPQNQGRWFVSGLASKPLGRVSQFGPQNR